MLDSLEQAYENVDEYEVSKDLNVLIVLKTSPALNKC